MQAGVLFTARPLSGTRRRGMRGRARAMPTSLGRLRQISSRAIAPSGLETDREAPRRTAGSDVPQRDMVAL